jgi:hypothetical protein
MYGKVFCSDIVSEHCDLYLRNYTVLYCTLLYSTLLYSTVLYSTVLNVREDVKCIQNVGLKAWREETTHIPMCRWEDNIKIDLKEIEGVWTEFSWLKIRTGMRNTGVLVSGFVLGYLSSVYSIS